MEGYWKEHSRMSGLHQYLSYWSKNAAENIRYTLTELFFPFLSYIYYFRSNLSVFVETMKHWHQELSKNGADITSLSFNTPGYSANKRLQKIHFNLTNSKTLNLQFQFNFCSSKESSPSVGLENSSISTQNFKTLLYFQVCTVCTLLCSDLSSWNP